MKIPIFYKYRYYYLIYLHVQYPKSTYSSRKWAKFLRHSILVSSPTKFTVKSSFCSISQSNMRKITFHKKTTIIWYKHFLNKESMFTLYAYQLFSHFFSSCCSNSILKTTINVKICIFFHTYFPGFQFFQHYSKLDLGILVSLAYQHFLKQIGSQQIV